MNGACRKIILAFGVCIWFGVHARERIINFESSVVIHKNATITVTENITVVSEGIEIKHGILREFPTTYRDTFGNWYRVKFRVQNILLDGKEVPFEVTSAPNGKIIRIGHRDIWLKPGTYTFTITYETDRQLGFFKDHDELFWNVTGSGWRLPIDHVTANVSLPSDVDPKSIKFTAYTGFQDEKGAAYTASVDENVVTFKTTKKFAPFEGLSVVVGFNKGLIKEPTTFQQWWWFFRDNIEYFFYLVGLLLILGVFFWIHRNNKLRKGYEPVIPLFYPPKDMTPGQMRYINSMGYDPGVLTADLVNMAVKGFLIIEYTSGWFGSGTYALKKGSIPVSNPLYHDLFSKLFMHGQALEVSKKNRGIIHACTQVLQRAYAKSTQGLFHRNASKLMLCVWIAGIATLLASIFSIESISVVFPLILFGSLMVFGYHWFRSYSVKGFQVKREIDGFKMFLEATEVERMKIIGTPPTRTPELYETYLPYAIALGVEKQWTQQFGQVFKALEAQGTPYRPIWYVGPRGTTFLPETFSTNVSRGLEGAISSSSVRPGGASGFGTGGGSGRGGGGGGGGGW